MTAATWKKNPYPNRCPIDDPINDPINDPCDVPCCPKAASVEHRNSKPRTLRSFMIQITAAERGHFLSSGEFAEKDTPDARPGPTVPLIAQHSGLHRHRGEREEARCRNGYVPDLARMDDQRLPVDQRHERRLLAYEAVDLTLVLLRRSLSEAHQRLVGRGISPPAVVRMVLALGHLRPEQRLVIIGGIGCVRDPARKGQIVVAAREIIEERLTRFRLTEIDGNADLSELLLEEHRYRQRLGHVRPRRPRN